MSVCRKTSSKVSHTRNPRPMWKQPCKVAAPETYSLQWQHVNLSQLEAFPLTLRSIDSSSPSRKRDQPDYAYSEHAKPSESLAAPVLKSAIMGGSQQNRHSPTQGGSHMVGPLKCSSNVMSKHSHAVNSKDRKADEASIMQHHTGLHTSATPACRADALGKHANCQHAKLTTPGRPSSLHLHQSVYTQHPVEQSDRQAAKHLAARGGFDSQHPKKASSSPTDTSQQPTDRPQSKTKPSHVQCPKQPTCNQASSRLSGRPGNVVKASPAPADDGSKGLQRQETLLGNWVRWAKPTADMVSFSCVSMNVALLPLLHCCSGIQLQ